MFPLCACGCDRQAPPESSLCDSGGAWWRMTCAAKALKGLRCLQNLPPDDLSVLVGVLRVNGFGLGDVVIASLPFSDV